MLALFENEDKTMAKEIIVIVTGHRDGGRVGRFTMQAQSQFIATHPNEIADKLIEINNNFKALGINGAQSVVVRVDQNLIKEVSLNGSD